MAICSPRFGRRGTALLAGALVAALASCGKTRADEGERTSDRAGQRRVPTGSSSSSATPPGSGGTPPASSPPVEVPIHPSREVPAGYHLDDNPVPLRTPPQSRQSRDTRPIEVVLRSTPAGAVAAVDGVRLGFTPTLWRGHADGQPHEFTFVLPGHAVARYRFVPLQNGVVHGTLERLTVPDNAGAGTGAAAER